MKESKKKRSKQAQNSKKVVEKTEKKKPESWYKKTWAYLILLALAVLLAYAPIFKGQFVWDDLEMVVNNPLIRSTDHVSHIFQSGAFLESAEAGKFYRPLQILSYAFDYALGQLNPTYFHVTSVVIHLLTVWVLFFLLINLNLSRALSLGVSLVYAVHPMNTEAVSYISGRGDVMYLLFCLISFYAFLKGLKKHKLWFLASVLTWILAIFSKENAIVLPLVMGAYLILCERSSAKFKIGMIVGLLGAVGGYIFFRLKVLHLATEGTLAIIALAPLWQRLLTIPHMVFLYLKLLFIPYPLHMEYHFVDVITSPYVWLGTVAIVGFFAFFLYQIRPIQKSLFFSAWFFIGLGPVYQLLPLASTIREHWVCFSQIGVFILVALYIEKVWKPFFIYLLAGVIIIFTGLTIVRNIEWQEPFKLYSHDVKYEPNSFLLHNNLGYEYYMQGNMALAKQAFFESIRVAPGNGYGTAMNNYAVILENEGRVEEAIPYFVKSIQVSQYQLAYANLGRILCMRREFSKAINILKEGSKIYPSHADIHFFLGVAYWQQGLKAEAKTTFQYLDNLYPNYKECRRIINAL